MWQMCQRAARREILMFTGVTFQHCEDVICVSLLATILTHCKNYMFCSLEG